MTEQERFRRAAIAKTEEILEIPTYQAAMVYEASFDRVGNFTPNYATLNRAHPGKPWVQWGEAMADLIGQAIEHQRRRPAQITVKGGRLT